MTKNYWAVTYNNGQQIDHTIELEQIDDLNWRVAIDDYDEFTMPAARQSSDFWGLVKDALAILERFSHQSL